MKRITKKDCVKIIKQYLSLCSLLNVPACENDFIIRIEKLIKKHHSYKFFFWEHLLNYQLGFSFEAHNLLIVLLSLNIEQRQKFEFLFIHERENSFIYLELMYKKYIVN